jgi:hypothetical protein
VRCSPRPLPYSAVKRFLARSGLPAKLRFNSAASTPRLGAKGSRVQIPPPRPASPIHTVDSAGRSCDSGGINRSRNAHTARRPRGTIEGARCLGDGLSPLGPSVPKSSIASPS